MHGGRLFLDPMCHDGTSDGHRQVVDSLVPTLPISSSELHGDKPPQAQMSITWTAWHPLRHDPPHWGLRATWRPGTLAVVAEVACLPTASFTEPASPGHMQHKHGCLNCHVSAMTGPHKSAGGCVFFGVKSNDHQGHGRCRLARCTLFCVPMHQAKVQACHKLRSHALAIRIHDDSAPSLHAALVWQSHSQCHTHMLVPEQGPSTPCTYSGCGALRRFTHQRTIGEWGDTTQHAKAPRSPTAGW